MFKKIKKYFLDKELQKKILLLENYKNTKYNNEEYIQNIIKKINFIKGDSIIGNDVYNDIEFFNNFNSNEKSNTIFEVFNNFNTIGSKEITKNIFLYPSADIELLSERKTLLESYNNIHDSDDLFKTLHNYENNIIWLFENREKHIDDLLNIVYFKDYFLKNLNTSSSTLTGWNLYRILISPLIGFLSPIVYFIIPFIVIIWKFKINISFTQYMKLLYTSLFSSNMIPMPSAFKYMTWVSYLFSFIFYFQGLFNSIEISSTLNKICSYIITNFSGVVKYLKASQQLVEKYWNDDIYKTFIHKNEYLLDSNIENNYINKLSDHSYNLLTNFGKQLHGYRFINRDIINSIVIKSYILDSIRSILYIKILYDFNFTNFINNDYPYININGIRHPCLDQNIVVKNDIILENNIIVTGPNAGGKSTFIKSLLINILLSQTFCITNSDSCQLTPFKNINSQINIPDSKGFESLFEAEMHRCSNNLNQLKNTENNDFTFIIMDEIFNSTNPIEGISGAYAIAKKISDYPKCLLIFTTHYNYLTKLAKTGKFINYKMNIIEQDDNIIFPYKLEKGLSKQFIALELLKKNGFDSDIIEEALQIKKKLTL